MRSYVINVIIHRNSRGKTKTATHSKSINEFSAWHDFHGSKAVHQIHLLLNLRGIALHAQGEEAGRATATEGEHADAGAPELGGLYVGDEGSKAAI